MSFKGPLAGIALATLVSLGGVTAPAHAQGVDFLWGGGSEWGGGRQTVSFSSQYKPGQVIVSFGDRRLYLITKPGTALSYPIAVPREQSRWQGTTFISDKRVNPSWTPTPTMIAENPRLPRWVPGGHPMNPLGVRGLYLGSSTYRIHGTDAPWTIGKAVSKGCVRMYNEDVLDLYPRVQVGTRVTVTWQRFSGKGVAAVDDEPPAVQAAAPQAKPVKAASLATNGKPEPQYEYVNPFEALFGNAAEPAPKKQRTTQVKKYTTTSALKPSTDAATAPDSSATTTKQASVEAPAAAAKSETADKPAAKPVPAYAAEAAPPAPVEQKAAGAQ